jgi:hypothetical protein
MPKPSTIACLPTDILTQLQQLLQDPRVTQMDITAKINGLLEAEGHPDRVSKSSVNRYAVKMEEIGAKLRQSREVAQMYVKQFGAESQGETGLMINGVLQAMAFDLSIKLQEADANDPETMSATIDQLKNLSLTIQRLEQSATINVKREGEIKKSALEDAAKTMEATAKNEGVSADTIQRIRRDVLMMAG